MIKAAIMQPTYMPWCGYFGLIKMVDIFVLYDDVQFDKRSWQQRNKIKTANGSQWLTVPVESKGMRSQKINEAIIQSDSNFSRKHIKAIELNYSKSKFYHEYKDLIINCIESNCSKLVDLNTSLIYICSKILSIETKFIKSSDLNVSGAKEERLIDICKKISADIYISPQGSKNYLSQGESFLENNIKLEYFEFMHPTYHQMYGLFEPQMSIIDVLFNCGASETRRLLESSSRVEGQAI